MEIQDIPRWKARREILLHVVGDASRLHSLEKGRVEGGCGIVHAWVLTKVGRSGQFGEHMVILNLLARIWWWMEMRKIWWS